MGSVREYAILYVGKPGSGAGGVIGGGKAITKTPQHALDGFEHTAATTDPTRLDANTTRHGLLPKLSGDADDALRGDGTWSAVLDSVTDGTVTVSPASSLTVTNGSLTDGGAGEAQLAYVTPTLGGQEVVNTVAASGATQTLDLADGNVVDLTLTAACAITTAGWVAGVSSSMSVIVRPGGFDPTFTDTIDWLGGSTPTWPSADDQYVVVLWSFDGGTSIGGTLVGSGTSDPALGGDLSGTASVASVDAVKGVVVTDAGGTGDVLTKTGATTATWSTPMAGGGGGELLIADSHSTPLVFADILQNEAQSDLMYADA